MKRTITPTRTLKMPNQMRIKSVSVVLPDAVNHPPHYTRHPSGVECIEIVEHMPYNIGSAIKYMWRCGLKANDIEDLEKAKFHIEREINNRKTAKR